MCTPALNTSQRQHHATCLVKALNSALEVRVDAAHIVGEQATSATANVHTFKAVELHSRRNILACQTP